MDLGDDPLQQIFARSQLFIICANTLGDLHANALIKTVGSGQALAIDTKPDALHTTLIKHIECLTQQRRTQSTLTPRPQHSELRDPALSIALTTQCYPCNL